MTMPDQRVICAAYGPEWGTHVEFGAVLTGGGQRGVECLSGRPSPSHAGIGPV